MIPVEPCHTPECQEQNAISWQCVCEFEARHREWVVTLRQSAASLQAELAATRKTRTDQFFKIHELEVKLEAAERDTARMDYLEHDDSVPITRADIDAAIRHLWEPS